MKTIANRLAAAAALALLSSAVPARAADPAQADAPYTEGSVWSISFIRVVPGMGDDYLRSLGTTWKRVMDEAKKQGIILSYKVLDSMASSPDDWDLLLLVEYKNWGALDGLDAKLRAIESKIVGGPEQNRALMTKRLEVRRILGAKNAREIFLK